MVPVWGWAHFSATTKIMWDRLNKPKALVDEAEAQQSYWRPKGITTQTFSWLFLAIRLAERLCVVHSTSCTATTANHQLVKQQR